ncbi:hypothetical protein [Lapidilactobacillus wuchangensis]|uniref:hypothetical protein n=1 Tax=Lapidilactobacillus wuchangensis TaxID=2486001 RepID=UPI000F783503|nr:hypothetical protein [Lapidilactobacillus wuchangensis]
MSDFDETVQQFFKDYHDRGMMKWAGFYLSDHTQQLEKVTRNLRYQPTKQPQLSREELTQLILKAFNHHLPIILQLNAIGNDSEQIQEYQGYVTALMAQGFYLGNQQFNLLEVHHVRLQPLTDTSDQEANNK